MLNGFFTSLLNFRPGSVIAFFSIILELPYYELITPLIKEINQTVASNQRNYLGDMAIQLLDVEAINGKFWISVNSTQNAWAFCRAWTRFYTGGFVNESSNKNFVRQQVIYDSVLLAYRNQKGKAFIRAKCPIRPKLIPTNNNNNNK